MGTGACAPVARAALPVGQTGQLAHRVDHLSGTIHSLCRAAHDALRPSATTGARASLEIAAIWGATPARAPLSTFPKPLLRLQMI